MREIKFRAWNKKMESMYSPDDNNSEMFMYLDGLLCYDGSPTEDYILMQFTGLKDKNGKEIYEGDICNMRRYSHIDSSRKWCVYEVCWGYSEWLFRGYWQKAINDEFFSIRFPEADEIEVIGNIYENPELLKE